MTLKVASVWPVNSLGEIVMQSGTGDQTVTGYLSQDQIPTDPSTNRMVINLPDLNALTLGDLLTGFVSGAGTVAATDTLLQAFNKLDGNTALRALNLLTGYVSGAGTVAATDSVLQGINKLNGNVELKAPIASPSLTGITTTQARQLGIREITAAGDITVNGTDDVILVNKTSGEATAAIIAVGTAGRTLTFKDKKGDANTNNITLTPTGQTIDGASTFVMNLAKQSVTLVFSGTEWSVI